MGGLVGGEWVGWWDDIAMTKLSVVGGGGRGRIGEKRMGNYELGEEGKQKVGWKRGG